MEGRPKQLLMTTFIQSIRAEIQAAFAPLDPLRFAGHSQPPPNWFGELEGKKIKSTSGPVLVNEETNTFEFDRTISNVPAYLTDLDKAGLRSRGLNPDGPFKPAYEAAKAYFSKQTGCSKADLAANSKTYDHDGFTAETAKHVRDAFKAALILKATF